MGKGRELLVVLEIKQQYRGGETRILQPSLVSMWLCWRIISADHVVHSEMGSACWLAAASLSDKPAETGAGNETLCEAARKSTAQRGKGQLF